MKQLTSFNRATVRNLGIEIQSALKSLCSKYGLGIEYRGCSFSELEMTPRLTVQVLDASGANAESKATWDAWAPVHKLKASDFGKTFRIGRDEFTIIGCSRKSLRFPIRARRSDGRPYKFTVLQVREALGHKISYKERQALLWQGR